MGNSNDICSKDPPVLTKLGSGKFGIVYAHDGDFKEPQVVKLYRDKDDCEGAKQELELQKYIYDEFDRQSQNAYVKRVKISKPIKHCYRKSGYKVNDQKYACFVIMTKLEGIPISIATNVIPKYQWGEQYWDQTYLKKLSSDPNYPVMIHTAFGPTFEQKIGTAGFYNIDWKRKIDENSGLRGYFGLKSDFQKVRVFGKLTANYKFDLTNENIEEIIGFVYSTMIHNLELHPGDIEFIIGKYPEGYKINILDFGKVLNFNADPESWGTMKQYLKNPVQHWLHSKKEDWSELDGFERYFMSGQYYGDRDNKHFKIGWDAATAEEEPHTAFGKILSEPLLVHADEELIIEPQVKVVNKKEQHVAILQAIDSKTNVEAFEIEKEKAAIKKQQQTAPKRDVKKSAHIGRDNLYDEDSVFTYGDYDNHGAHIKGEYRAYVDDGHYSYYGNYDNYGQGLIIMNLLIAIILFCCAVGSCFIICSIFSFLFFSTKQSKLTNSRKEMQRNDEQQSLV